MKKYVYYLILCLVFSLLNSKLSSIEDISSTFSFELINKVQNDSGKLIIDPHSSYIYPYNISFIKNFMINSSFYDALISTNLSDSIFLSDKNITHCDLIDNEGLINNSQFIFKGCCYLLEYSFPPLYESNFSNDFYQIYDIQKSNSELEYDAILSLPSLQYTSMVVLDYINYNIKLVKDELTEEEKDIFDEYLKTMIKCNNTLDDDSKVNNQPSEGKFFCKIDYLLFGTEGEKDDPYFAKEISVDKVTIAYFDNLSTYTIFPYIYLNYFLSTFFSKYNDKCEEYFINSVDLYYIACPRKQIEIFSYARNMSVIINYHSFPLKNLFNESLRILGGSSSNELIYLNILFNKSADYFIFGTNFFMGKMIGYNFLDNSTYIYSNEYIDFTSAFSGESSGFQALLYCLTIGAFSCLLIISGILTLLHNRKIEKELKNIFNDSE